MNGEAEATMAYCTECDQEFDCDGTWDVEFHNDHGTHRELLADDDTCPACCGKASCDTEGCKRDATTRKDVDGVLRSYSVLCEVCYEEQLAEYAEEALHEIEGDDA